MTHLAEAQRDAMAEMVNIGMGQAGDSLARLFNTFIRLSVPRIQLVAPADLHRALAALCGEHTPVIATRQAFSSCIRGEALVFYTAESCDGLAELVGYPGAQRDELLLDITNVLVGACVGGLASQFSLELAMSAPSLLGASDRATDLLDASAMAWQAALLSEVNFRVEARTFQCHLLTFWPDASLGVLVKAVDELLAAV
jgi:chemotaxis protein CheC